MPSKTNKTKVRKKFLGRYKLPSGMEVVGDLHLNHSRTSLTLHSDQDLSAIRGVTFIKGTAFTGECLSLIDCHSAGGGHAYEPGGPVRYHASVFPHYVLIGKGYIDPAQACVRSIEFTTGDLGDLFYDFDAFGSVINSATLIQAVAEAEEQAVRSAGFEPRRMPVGDVPIITYFAGRTRIAEVQTTIGLVRVEHRPSYDLGSPAGVSIKNRMMVSLTPELPVVFSTAVSALHDLSSFLSMAIGRYQSFTHIRAVSTESAEGFPLRYEVHPSYRIKAKFSDEFRKPHPGDMLLDPIHRPEEFSLVLANWIERHEGWRIARSRYQDCTRNATLYDPNRIVAAANMFDLLPASATPNLSEVPSAVLKARDECVRVLKLLPQGVDRNFVLNALGRIGKPALPKKVAYRVSLIRGKFGTKLPGLEGVATMAVKCRNYFVHGSDQFDYPSLVDLVPFFTDTLEFVFAASDLIEAGWDPAPWLASHHGTGHSFAHYFSHYRFWMEQLRNAQPKASTDPT